MKIHKNAVNNSRWGHVVLAAVLLIAATLSIYRNATITKAAPTPPVWTVSYYVHTTDTTVLENAGRTAGQRSLSYGPGFGLIVLDLGQPRYLSKIGYTVTTFGHGYPDDSMIAIMIRAFAKGIYDVIHGAGSTNKLRIAVGTTNFENNDGIGEVTYSHGNWFATTVNLASTTVANAGYGAIVTVSGANDMELTWSTPDATINWVNGWAYSATHVLYDYGSAEGCYRSTPPNYCTKSKNPEYATQPSSGYADPPYNTVKVYGRFWQTSDVWNVAERFKTGGGHPLPEIYQYNQEGTWQQLSAEAAQVTGTPLTIVGSMSSNGKPPLYTADQSWSKLYDALNSSTVTKEYPSWSTVMSTLGSP